MKLAESADAIRTGDVKVGQMGLCRGLEGFRSKNSAFVSYLVVEMGFEGRVQGATMSVGSATARGGHRIHVT